MTIYVPDPDIGRCENYHTKTHADGYVETRRCNDYSTVPHECWFDPWAHVSTSGGAWSGTRNVTPKPWVRPHKAAVGMSTETETP